jgi:superfamily II DNA or RNA helicase
MKLLAFQQTAVNRVTDFLTEVKKWRSQSPDLPNAAQVAWDCLEHQGHIRPYCTVKDSKNLSIPCAAVVIPTGGGKTITALASGIAAMGTLRDDWCFLVWVVPSEAIYVQTRKYLEDGYLFDFATSAGFRGLNLKTIGDIWTDIDLDKSVLTVLLVSQQSIFGDRADLHFRRPSDALRHLSLWRSTPEEPSLFNFLHLIRPIFLIDECHRTYTETGRAFFQQNALAEVILEFSATPKDFSGSEYPNVLHSSPARDLIDEELLKNPLVCHFEPNSSIETLIKNVVSDRKKLEKSLAIEGYRPKPKFLISCRRTSELHADDPLSVQTIRDILISEGVNEARIAIKSAQRDDLVGVEIDSFSCQIEFVLTQRALVEGWDAKSVFGIVLVNEIGASLTNFQIVGRGLRQPDKKYFTKPELNAVHVYLNSDKQDHALKQLGDFLVGEGLSNGLAVTSGTQNIGLPKVEIDSRSIKVPALDIKMSSVGLTAIATRMMTQDTPAYLSADECRSQIGIAHNSVAVVTIGSPFDSSTQVTSHSSRNLYQLNVWKSHFRKSSIKLLAHYFETSFDCIRWVDGQFEFFNESGNLQTLLQFDPIRVSNQLKIHLEPIFQKQRHIALIRLISEADIKWSEIAGSFAPPLFAAADSHPIKPFLNSLTGDTPKSLFNGDELKFARFVDELGVPWFRNNPGRKWYAVPGGSGSQFYPDFVICLNESDSRTYGKVIAIETKGAHLVDNADSIDKREISETITSLFNDRINMIFEDFESVQICLMELLGSQ